MELTAKQRQYLRALAHSQKPVVQIGSKGVGESVFEQIRAQLQAHELIKVRAGEDDRDARRQLWDAVCERTGAEAVQQVGKVLVLWRPNPEDDSAD